MVHGRPVVLLYNRPGTQVSSILLLQIVKVAPSPQEEGERRGEEQTGINARARPEVTSSLLLTSHWPEYSVTWPPLVTRETEK